MLLSIETFGSFLIKNKPKPDTTRGKTIKTLKYKKK